jgi:hypothetical protein
LGIRQAMNEHQVASASIAGLIIVGILAFLVMRGCSSETDSISDAAPTKAFFSTDDGKTYFVDDANRIPPFTVDKAGDPNHGKVAWGARVVRCGNAAPIVHALEKYADPDKQKLEALVKQHGDRATALAKGYMDGAAVMLKKPGTGDKGWVKLDANNMTAFNAIARPKCPDGGHPEVLRAE